MTTVSAKVKKFVTCALREEKSLHGYTTVDNVVALAYRRIEQRGGCNAFFSTADIIMAVKNILRHEAQSQLKSRMPDNVYEIAMRNAPPDLVQTMPYLPGWIAIGDGPGARWVPSLAATIEDWSANARLKEKKAVQTERKARFSIEVVDYLKKYGLLSLSEVIKDVT